MDDGFLGFIVGAVLVTIMTLIIAPSACESERDAAYRRAAIGVASGKVEAVKVENSDGTTSWVVRDKATPAQ
jgi:gas vesicle protein